MLSYPRGRVGIGCGTADGGRAVGAGLTVGRQPGLDVVLGCGVGGSVGRPGCGGFDGLQSGTGVSAGLPGAVGRTNFGGRGVTLSDGDAVGRGLPCPEASSTSEGPTTAADAHAPAASNAVPPTLAAAMAILR